MAGKGREVEGCCANCAKWCLIIFNVIFSLFGIGLIAAGVYAYIELRDYLDIVGNKMINAPAIVLIVFGVITFAIAAMGCIGACKESSCLLYTFAAIIGILLVAEIVAGGVAFAYRDDIKMWITDNSVAFMKDYKEGDDSIATDAWDKLQEKIGCCGINGASDWKNNSIAPNQGTNVPKSCGENTKGCIATAIERVLANIILVGGIGVGFGVVELMGIVLACCLACNISRKE